MKRNHNYKELDQLQRIKKENDKLKRQVSALRKELARMDLDKYGQLKETIEQHCQEHIDLGSQNILEKVKKEWSCKECDGYLEIFTYSRAGSTMYYRICSNAPKCKNRTPAQRYSPDVKGITRKSNESK